MSAYDSGRFTSQASIGLGDRAPLLRAVDNSLEGDYDSDEYSYESGSDLESGGSLRDSLNSNGSDGLGPSINRSGGSSPSGIFSFWKSRGTVRGKKGSDFDSSDVEGVDGKRRRRKGGKKKAEDAGGNKLGTFMGVFVPCLLNTFGVIVFERLGWVIAEAGVLQTLGMFALGYAVIILSVLSLSAIATNGRVQGGGTYYLVSRSLGPEFGGSIGLVFYTANVFGAAFYLIGFADAFVTAFGELGFPDDRWARFGYASVGLIICMVICFLGANMFARASLFILIVMASSMAIAVGSFVFRPPDQVTLPEGQPPGANFTGPSLETFRGNLESHYQPKGGDDYDFMAIFAILFPGLTGLLAGSNMSGDLKNAGKSIPKGTVSAGIGTFLIYGTLVVAISSTVTNEALYENYFILMFVCVYGKPIVATGIFAAVTSSALAALVGAGRVIQAIARDDLFPILRIFGQGTKKGDEPVYGLILTYILVQGVLLIGELNVIAPFVTMFFLLSFLATNFACFFLRVTGAPNFRPSFRYFHWSTALLGAISSAVIMFVVDAIKAAISFVIVLAIFAFIHYRGPSESIAARYGEWGNLSQGLIYHQVRKYLLMIDTRSQHVKFWRPQILLMCKSFGDQATEREVCDQVGLAKFTNYLKKGGLYVLGSVVVGDHKDFRQAPALSGSVPPSAGVGASSLRSAVGMFEDAFSEFINAFKLKAFGEVAVASTLRGGMQNLLLCSGIGGMKVNTLLLGFPESAAGGNDAKADTAEDSKFGSAKAKRDKRLPADLSEAERQAIELFPNEAEYRVVSDDSGASSRGAKQVEYVEMIRDCIELGHNVILARHFHKQRHQDELLSHQKAQQGRNQKPSTRYVDVWLLPVAMLHGENAPKGQHEHARETLSTLLMLGNILKKTEFWDKHTELRVLSFVELTDDAIKETDRINEDLFRYRIQATATVFSLSAWAKERLHTVGSFVEITSEKKRVLTALADLDQDEFETAAEDDMTGNETDSTVEVLTISSTSSIAAPRKRNETSSQRRRRILKKKQALHENTLRMSERDRNSLINELILSISNDARLVLLPMPHPPEVDTQGGSSNADGAADAISIEWLAAQEQLTRGLPSCMLVCGTKTLLTEQL